jgi:GGDEF domain-containing protein
MRTAHPRVLLAETGVSETGLMLRALYSEGGRALEVRHVSKRNDLPLEILTYCPDVAFLDLKLFQPDPPAGIYSLHHEAPHIPLILFAPIADRNLAERCLRVGARDFMLEGYMDGRMLNRVLRSALSEPPAEAHADACSDPLTGLMNRVGLVQESHRWKKWEGASARRLLVSIRVENLDAIQTGNGNVEAQLLLRKLAHKLQKKIRSSDTIAHVAPGHFVLMIGDVAERGLPAVHRRIANCLADFNEEQERGTLPMFALHSEFLPTGEYGAFTELLAPAGVPESIELASGRLA